MPISSFALLLAIATSTLPTAQKDCLICPPETIYRPEAPASVRPPDPEYSPAFKWSPVRDDHSNLPDRSSCR